MWNESIEILCRWSHMQSIYRYSIRNEDDHDSRVYRSIFVLEYDLSYWTLALGPTDWPLFNEIRLAVCQPISSYDLLIFSIIFALWCSELFHVLERTCELLMSTILHKEITVLHHIPTPPTPVPVTYIHYFKTLTRFSIGYDSLCELLFPWACNLIRNYPGNPM